MALNIVFEDNKIIVVDKPAGKLTQSAKSFDLDLVSEIMSYRKRKGEVAYAAVINRLDRPVSGLVLFAKDAKTAAELSKNMQGGGFNKEYMAYVCGYIEESGTYVDYLEKDGKSNTSHVAKDAGKGKKAELKFKLVSRMTVSCNGKQQELSLVNIKLLTGRHHQIRAQFSSRNFPLLGDVKYGGISGEETQPVIVKRSEIALCAYKLSTGKKEYEITPSWME